MAIKPFPLDASDLLVRIDEEFPPRCIAKDETLEDHLRYAGKRELIDELKLRLEAAERINKD